MSDARDIAIPGAAELAELHRLRRLERAVQLWADAYLGQRQSAFYEPARPDESVPRHVLIRREQELLAEAGRK